MALELDVAIQVAFLRVSPSGGPPENAVVLYDRHGVAKVVYSKVHTAVWSQCESMTAPGNRLYIAVLDTARAGMVTVGSMICADREYPETPRILAEMGAEVLLVRPRFCANLLYKHLDSRMLPPPPPVFIS